MIKKNIKIFNTLSISSSMSTKRDLTISPNSFGHISPITGVRHKSSNSTDDIISLTKKLVKAKPKLRDKILSKLKAIDNKISRSKVLNKKNGRKTQGYILRVPPYFIQILKDLLTQHNIIFDVDGAVQSVVEFHNKMILHHGVIDGTKRFAQVRLYAINHLEGRNPDNPGWVATSRKGKWPSKLAKLYQLRELFNIPKTDKQAIACDQVIRSILYINRLVSANGVVDLESITKVSVVPQEEILRFENFLSNRKGIKFDGELISRPLTKVVAFGPNQKPKWQTAEVEAYVLTNSELSQPFKKLCEATNNLELYEYMKRIADRQDRVERKKLRYITSIKDKGNKSRPVAIGDYWTSIILMPIMKDIQLYNKRNFAGCSYSHDHDEAWNQAKSRSGLG